MLALTLAAAAAACGDDDPAGPDPVEHTYSMEVTGDLDEDADGPAWFGSDVDEEGQAVWALVFGDDDDRHFVVVGKDGSARPGPGTYPIVDPESEENGWTLIHIVSDGEELLGLFAGIDGTVTITESADGEVKGTIEFDAEGILGLGEAEIHATGSFNAQRTSQVPSAAARIGSR